MRFAALIAFCVLIGWFLVPRVELAKPDARLETFAERTDPNRPHPVAPVVPESAERKQIRQTMLNAANRLENSPCDKSLREPLRIALEAYIKARRENDPRAPEEDVTIYREAGEAGILQPGGVINAGYRGRFACRIGND
jgi:hypothetical protein